MGKEQIDFKKISAELSVLLSINSIPFYDDFKTLFTEVSLKAVRIFDLKRFGILVKKGNFYKLVSSFGIKNKKEALSLIKKHEEFVYPLGKIGFIYIEPSRPVNNREKVIYSFFVNKVNEIARRIILSKDREKLTKELKESLSLYKNLSNKYQKILNSLPVGIILVERDFTITYENNEAKSIMGIKETETPVTLGKNIFELLSTKKVGAKMIKDKILNLETVEEKTFFRSIYGKEVFIKYKVVPIEEDGRFNGALIVIDDLTKQKKMEDELRVTQNVWHGTLKILSRIVEIRDPYTAGHQQRVAYLSKKIAKEMHLPQEKIDSIYIAALVHDIGKIAVPTEILSRPGKLTKIEKLMIREHPTIGYEILKDIDFPWPIAQIVLQHHEKINGSGYPLGLKGDEIMIEARIICVSDVVEAMSTRRPYREAFDIETALEEIIKYKGVLYDPDVVDTCVRLFKEKKLEFTGNI
jgi:PAS domain S-box-containing protein/putative nucleotidyltransferase with HDIG domain